MDILMPQFGETVAEGTVTLWHKKVGDVVAADEALFEVETEKVTTEIPSPIAGVLTEIVVPAGQTVKVGTRLAVVRGPRDEASSEAPERAATTSGEAATRPGSAAQVIAAARSPGTRLSPVVRRLLVEHQIDGANLRGTGSSGRVTRNDVLAHVRLRGVEADGAVPPSRIGTHERVVGLNKVRRRSAAAMAKAWQAVPHVLQAIEADYSRIESARRSKGTAWRAREGFGLTYLPFLAWATCRALARFDQLNARIDGDTLVVSRRIHLGIAVDLHHEGLVVPVVRDAQDRDVASLAREIHRLAVGARDNSLGPEDFPQPTYTLSNSGAFGTLITAPIVNPPQVAILSTDGVSKRPVVVESADGDSIAVRPVGILAQSFDHRAVDGAYSAAFLRELKSIIETHAWTQSLG